MPRPPVTSLDEAIDRSIQEQAENPYRPPTASALTQQIERSRQRQANIPGHHLRVNPYAAASAESDEDSDSDDSGLQIKYPSSKRPGDGPRQMMTPTPRRPNEDERDPQAARGNTLHAERPRRQRNEDTPSQPRQMMTPRPRRRPNEDEPKSQPTRENTLHAERPRRQRNEDTSSQQRPARIPSLDLFEGQIPDGPRPMMTPRPRRSPNDDEENPQPTRGNTLHAERPQRQRNEDILSQQRPARIPSSDFFFEGQIPDEPAIPQKPQAVRVKPPPQAENSRQQPHDDPRSQRPARISIPDILNHGTTNFQRPQAAQRPSKQVPKPQPEEAQRPSKPAPKPQPAEPKPESSSQNQKKSAGLPIPKPLHLGFPRPPKPTQAMQLQSVTAQGRQPVEEEPDDSPTQRRRRDRRRTTRSTVSDSRDGCSESDDDIFVFQGGGEDGKGTTLSDLKSAGR